MPDPLEVLESGLMSPEQWAEIEPHARIREELEGRTEVSPKLIERMVRVARLQARRDADPKTPHYARFTAEIIKAIHERLPGDSLKILDPMSGDMLRLRQLERAELGSHEVHGVELEKEWTANHPHPRLIHGDARSMPYEDEFFDVIACSPPYGNRQADSTHLLWDSVDRKTYSSALGRGTSKGSACVPFHDPAYAKICLGVWVEATRVLKTGGTFVINTKNFVRQGRVVAVTTLHRRLLASIGLTEVDDTAVPAKGLPAGANHDVRAESVEKIIVWRKPPGAHERAARLKEELTNE